VNATAREQCVELSGDSILSKFIFKFHVGGLYSGTNIKTIFGIPTKNFSIILQNCNNKFISLPAMKEYTQADALTEIFDQPRLTAKMNVYKHRFIKGELSQKLVDDIILTNGFEVIQEKLYMKK
jgi:hypothetical protein